MERARLIAHRIDQHLMLNPDQYPFGTAAMIEVHAEKVDWHVPVAREAQPGEKVIRGPDQQLYVLEKQPPIRWVRVHVLGERQFAEPLILPAQLFEALP